MDNKFIAIDIDNIKILTCTKKNFVYLKADLFFNDDICDCVVIMKRAQFSKAINDILNRKKDYNNLGCGFAGVGSIFIDEYEELENPVYLNYYDEKEDSVTNVEVPTYVAKKIVVDMEHG